MIFQSIQNCQVTDSLIDKRIEAERIQVADNVSNVGSICKSSHIATRTTCKTHDALEASPEDVPASMRCALMVTFVLASLLGPASNARAATAPSGGGRYLGGVRNAKTPRTTRESAQVCYARGATTAVVASPRRFKNHINQIIISRCCVAHGVLYKHRLDVTSIAHGAL